MPKGITKKSKAIRRFIIERVDGNKANIVDITAKKFSISRHAVYFHIKKLVDDGLLTASGRTRARRFALRELVSDQWFFTLRDTQSEHEAWNAHLKGPMENVSENAYGICAYGFMEIFNNATEHSEGSKVAVELGMTAEDITLFISDDGIGIFNKISDALDLSSPREAALELAKGKFTTDPERHTGEGIFFTSRMFDNFCILSGPFFFSHARIKDEWVLEDNRTRLDGTRVKMTISRNTPQTTLKVFEGFETEREEKRIVGKTHIPISLLQFSTGQLISRSQARRLLSRCQDLDEVMLDFSGVSQVGPAFIDEVFRVFRHEHPHVALLSFNANARTERMIGSAMEA